MFAKQFFSSLCIASRLTTSETREIEKRERALTRERAATFGGGWMILKNILQKCPFSLAPIPLQPNTPRNDGSINGFGALSFGTGRMSFFW